MSVGMGNVQVVQLSLLLVPPSVRIESKVLIEVVALWVKSLSKRMSAPLMFKGCEL